MPAKRLPHNISRTRYKYTLANGQVKEKWRYFVTSARPKVWLGFDLEEAVLRYQRWEAAQQPSRTITVPDYTIALTPEELDILRGQCAAEGLSPEETERHIELHYGPVQFEANVPLTSKFWMVLRAVLNDPQKRKQAAALTGWKQLEWLGSLEMPAETATLNALLERYCEKQMTHDWLRKCKQYWREFCRLVNAKTVRELSHEQIAHYRRTILDRGKSVTYGHHRFGVIKSVFHHAAKLGLAADDVQKALLYCRQLEKPKGPQEFNPRPISREHFQALLQAAAPKWKAALLLSLNCAFYAQDVCDVERSHVNLDRGTLAMFRSKTKVPRIGVLWQETIEAIKGYQHEEPHRSRFIFVSRTGAPYHSNHVGRNFRRIREKAGVPVTVEYNHIRDGAKQAALDAHVPDDRVDMLMGHRAASAKDNYTLRKPHLVEVACKAIWEHYLG